MAESRLQSLVEVFNNSFFRIPDYQRGYAWGKEQLEDFWEDIGNLKSDKFHYTGLLTVESIDKKDIENNLEKWKDDLWMFDKGLKAYYVIDGQQRLTTVIILLKVILDKFDESEGINFESKESWVARFLYREYGKYKSYAFGYEKDNPSDEFFKTKILNQVSLLSALVPEQTLYTMNLKQAKEFFEKKIKTLKKDEIETIFKKVVNSLKFNFYEIDSDLDVFVTFETMNNRGKNLSKLELLKNRLIYLTTLLQNKESDKDRIRREINEAWKTVYEYLGKNKDNPLDDDEFLENHWKMYFKYKRSEAEVYARFLLKEYFIAKNILSERPSEFYKIGFDEIRNYVESISKSVREWFYIHNPSFSNYNQDIKIQLEKINRLGFSVFKPLIMAAMVKGIEEENLLELLKNAERFEFLVFRLSKRQSNTGSSYFYGIANEFYVGKKKISDVNKGIETAVDGDKEYYGSFQFDVDDFKKQIKDLFKGGWEGFYSWNGLKYFLYEYELDLQSRAKGNNKVKWEDIKQESIEHIYPEKASEKCWKSNFDGISSNNSKFLLHSIGNLLLLSQSKNSELQNKCFDFKKKHTDKKGNQTGYYNGSYSEIEVAQREEWTPNTIFERGLEMLKFMEKRWNIKLGNDEAKKKLLLLDFVK